ncbi:YraN family protein [Neokomagataea tanensis]|uniref:UPF0102 protein D5366_10860 n=1 Tax=Neokomagataea tanensis TaxID=661191 RepID=A0A4Y6V8G1_9PROT|nr:MULTISPECIES: YraN family protein [Neokomagataea]QDH25634.1 YraN family protein [Neokomagataea tanensis]
MSYKQGLGAEHLVAERLKTRGYQILAQRLRTPLGEVDLVTCTDERLVVVEVKQRKSLRLGAEALSTKQRERLLAAFDYIWSAYPEWQRPEARLDYILVTASGEMKRIKDALRQE